MDGEGGDWRHLDVDDDDLRQRHLDLFDRRELGQGPAHDLLGGDGLVESCRVG